MIDLQIDSPMPMPESFVVTNESKSVAVTSSVIPGPVPIASGAARGPASGAERPSGGPYSIGFERGLRRHVD